MLGWLGRGGGRDGKTYEPASNARVNLFLARVKYLSNFTLFVAKMSYVISHQKSK